MIDARVDYKPQTGRISIWISTDASNPDAADDLARRAVFLFRETLQAASSDWADGDAEA